MKKLTYMNLDTMLSRLAWFAAAFTYAGLTSMSAWASNHSSNADFADMLRMALLEEMAVTISESRQFLVNWSSVSGADKYQLRYRRNGDSGWTEESPTASSGYSLTLTEGSYELQVAACVEDTSTNTTYCGGDVSQFSNSYNLTVDGVTYNPDTPNPIQIATAPQQSDEEKSVGGLNGNAKVSGSGDATWSLNFELPAGIGGYAPGVGVSYSGSSSNSVLGVGWQLTASSSIMRCREFYEEDGQYSEVTFTNADQLCFGGSRLVLKPGDIHFASMAEYRLKNDPTVKVIYHTSGTNNYFVMHRPNGETWTFGDSTATRVHDIESQVPYKWLLAEKQDTYQNNITYAYTGSDSQARHIDSIAYSGNVIDFQYGTRTDGRNGYYQGNQIIDNALLTDVVIKNHNNVAINSYHFEHQPSNFSSRNLVKRIKRCNGAENGTCLQPTSFEYEENLPMGLEAANQEIVITLSDHFTVHANENSDYCDNYFQVPQTYCSAKSLELGDTDGDGLPELIALMGYGEDYKYQNFKITPTGYETGQATQTGQMFTGGVSVGPGITQPYWGAGLEIRDMDGDGLDEIYVTGKFQGSSGSSVWGDLDGDGLPEAAPITSLTAEQHATDNYPFTGAEDCDLNIHLDYEVDSRPASTLDFNGDGLTDILYSVSGTCTTQDGLEGNLGEDVYYLLKNTSVGDVYSDEIALLPGFGIHATTRFGDFNNDGYLDSTSNGCLTGEGTQPCLAENGIVTSGGVADFNADGRDDVISLAGNNINVNISRIATHFAGALTTHLGTHSFTDIPTESAVFHWADIDGDGLPAFIYFDKGSQTIHIRHDANTGNKKVDALLTVNNGMGQTSTFEYEQMTATNVYERKTDKDTSTWGSPVFDAKGSGHLVKRFSQTVGANAAGQELTAEQTFKYEGLRTQAGGRGSLGFAKVIITDVTNQQRTTTEYRQQYPYNGQMKKQTQELVLPDGSSFVMTETEITDWHEHSYFGGEIIQVSAKTSQTKRYTADGVGGAVSTVAQSVHLLSSATSTSTISTSNGYPAVTRNVVTTVDEISNNTLVETTDYLYESEDEVNWRINRVTGTTKTTVLTNSSQYELSRSVQLSAQSYNSNGKVATRSVGEMPVDNSAANAVQTSQYLLTDFKYDSHGNTVRTTQCSGHFVSDCDKEAIPADIGSDIYHVYNRKSVDYDNAGRYINAVSNSLFTESIYSDYNPLGQPGKITDANGVYQQMYYDAFGRTYFVASNTGAHTRSQAGLCSGNAACPASAYIYSAVTDSNAPDTVTFYDVSGTEVGSHTESLNGSWIEVINEYNARGQLISSSVPHFITASSYNSGTREYDALGRAWKEVAADGTKKEYSWSGTTETQTISSEHTGIYSSASISQTNQSKMNGLGQRITSVDGNNNSTWYEYNALGLLAKTTNVDGTVVTIEYDDYGRKTALNDADKGDISYHYNASGVMVQRVSPTQDKENSYFDGAGRLVKKETISTAGNVVADFVYTGHLLDHETGSEGIRREYQYELEATQLFTRLKGVTHKFDKTQSTNPQTGETTVSYAYEEQTSIVYDHLGRVFQEFDASGSQRGIQYDYKNGYTWRLQEAQNSAITYYQANNMDAYSNITYWTLGNGDEGTATFDPDTGYMTGITGADGSLSLQEHVYEYDGLGNLRARIDKNGDGSHAELVESFDYDNLNRLQHVYFRNQVSAPQNPVASLALTYYANGNIKTKSDVSSSDYLYGTTPGQCTESPGVHALTAVGNKSYCYDKRGNQTESYTNGVLQREVTYTGFDKPLVIESKTNNAKSTFSYDTSHQRYKRLDEDSDGTRATYYVGNTEIVRHGTTGLVEVKRYIGNYTIDIVRSNGIHQTRYLHRDHIGSISIMTDADSSQVTRLSHDAFGKRRDGSTWDAIQNVVANSTIKAALNITHKGFTGHEHVDHADVIHMGGRIYDPVVGRFMQADPIVQAPDNSQSFNRYSYVFNNPLSYTDPTGYKAVRDERGSEDRSTNDTEAEQRKAFRSQIRKHAKKLGMSTAMTMRVVNDAMADYDKAVASQGAFSQSGEAGGDSIVGSFERGRQASFEQTVSANALNAALASMAYSDSSGDSSEALNDTNNDFSDASPHEISYWDEFKRVWNQRVEQITEAADFAVDYWVAHDNPVMGTLAATMNSKNIGNTTLSLTVGALTAPLGGSAALNSGVASYLIKYPTVLRFMPHAPVKGTLTAAGWQAGKMRASTGARGGWSMTHQAGQTYRIQWSAAGGRHKLSYWKVSSNAGGVTRVPYFRFGDVPKLP